MVSKPALPRPTTTAARSVVTGTAPPERIAAVSARLRRWGERSVRSSPRPPRKTTCRTPARSASAATVSAARLSTSLKFAEPSEWTR